MLKRDGFQLTDPTLFNAALASASMILSQQARSSSAGSVFLRAKRRESLLAHTSVPVPEAQRKALTVAPGSESVFSLFLLLSAGGSRCSGLLSFWQAVRQVILLFFSYWWT